MNLKEIKDLIDKINDSNIGELKISDKDFRLSITHKDYVRKGGQQIVTTVQPPQAINPSLSSPAEVPAPPANSSNSAKQGTESKIEPTSNQLVVKSPMIGTFYRSPSPDKDPYVKVGDQIETGDTLCVIEAMKLFNEIESELSGKIIKVLVENATPVEYDQPLFLIEA